MMPEHAVTSGYFAFALLLIAPSIKSELLTRKKKEIIFSAFKTHIVGSIMIIIMTYLFFLLKCGIPELISLMLAIIIGAIIIAAIALSPKAILHVLTDKDFQTTCKKTINDKIEEFIINKIK